MKPHDKQKKNGSFSRSLVLRTLRTINFNKNENNLVINHKADAPVDRVYYRVLSLYFDHHSSMQHPSAAATFQDCRAKPCDRIRIAGDGETKQPITWWTARQKQNGREFSTRQKKTRTESPRLVTLNYGGSSQPAEVRSWCCRDENNNSIQ